MVRKQNRSLTNRERDMLMLILEGRQNRQIALQLGIAKKTAEAHIRNLFIKMDVKSRTQIYKKAIEHGWVAFTKKYRDTFTTGISPRNKAKEEQRERIFYRLLT